MEPFDLRNHQNFTERFRAQTDNILWDAGTFDYMITIKHLSDDNINELCEWLSNNCTENFIAIKKTKENVAGGSTNNKVLWKRRKIHGPDKFHHVSTEIEIRLDRDDITAFRLTWIL